MSTTVVELRSFLLFHKRKYTFHPKPFLYILYENPRTINELYTFYVCIHYFNHLFGKEGPAIEAIIALHVGSNILYIIMRAHIYVYFIMFNSVAVLRSEFRCSFMMIVRASSWYHLHILGFFENT